MLNRKQVADSNTSSAEPCDWSARSTWKRLPSDRQALVPATLLLSQHFTHELVQEMILDISGTDCRSERDFKKSVWTPVVTHLIVLLVCLSRLKKWRSQINVEELDWSEWEQIPAAGSTSGGWNQQQYFSALGKTYFHSNMLCLNKWICFHQQSAEVKGRHLSAAVYNVRKHTNRLP